jgi:hypothetical protein
MPYSYAWGSARDLEKRGVWFRDRDGRHVLFRGVNFAGSSKRPPFLPVSPKDSVAGVLQELDRLRELGFNVVRLLTIWKALEPAPQAAPETLSPQGVLYLQELRKVIDALFERGIFTIVSFHQDIAHELYGGDGFPDWALASEPAVPRPAPADLRDRQWAVNYAVPATDRARSCRRTLASFWRNDLRNDQLSATDQQRARPVRDHYIKTMGATARWFQALNGGMGHPGVLGYGLFNEPHETELAADELEKTVLPDLYLKATQAIRTAGDSRAFLFIQPRVGWNQFTMDPRSALETGKPDPRTVFAFHHYDSWTISQDFVGLGDSMQNKQKEWPLLFDRMRAGAVWRGLIPFITELGATHYWDAYTTNLRPDVYRNQTRAYMDLQMQQTEKYLLNWTYWNYNLYNDPVLKDGWNLEDFSLLGPNRQPRDVDIVSRPYPMRSSAEPASSFFDIGNKHFALRLRGPVVDAPTVVFVPRRLHYPTGFEVRASNRAALEWNEARQLLYWRPDKARDANLMVISPAGVFRQDALPFFAREVFSVAGAPVRMA